MDFRKNYFELFGVDASFTIDLKTVSEKFLELQRKSHPDKFTTESAAEQRLAVQFSAYVNTANQTLKSPLLRAEYLLELVGHPLNRESMTINDSQFLMAQMECRESLSELADRVKADSIDVMAATEALEVFSVEANKERAKLIESFAPAYADQQFTAAQQAIAKLHFVEKMLLEIERIEDNLLV
jgi:molecular chaperone HscB